MRTYTLLLPRRCFKSAPSLLNNHSSCPSYLEASTRYRYSLYQSRGFALADLSDLPKIKYQTYKRSKLGLTQLPVEVDEYSQTLGYNEDIDVPSEYRDIPLESTDGPPGRTAYRPVELDTMPWDHTLNRVKQGDLTPSLALCALRDTPWLNIDSANVSNDTGTLRFKSKLSDEEYNLLSDITTKIVWAFTAAHDVRAEMSDLGVRQVEEDLTLTHTFRSLILHLPVHLKVKLLLALDLTHPTELTVPAVNDPELQDTFDNLKPVDMEKVELDELSLGKVRGTYYGEIKVVKSPNHVTVQKYILLSVRQDILHCSLEDVELIVKCFLLVGDKVSVNTNEIFERLTSDVVLARLSGESPSHLVPHVHTFSNFLRNGKHFSETSVVKAHKHLLESLFCVTDIAPISDAARTASSHTTSHPTLMSEEESIEGKTHQDVPVDQVVIGEDVRGEEVGARYEGGDEVRSTGCDERQSKSQMDDDAHEGGDENHSVDQGGGAAIPSGIPCDSHRYLEAVTSLLSCGVPYTNFGYQELTDALAPIIRDLDNAVNNCHPMGVKETDWLDKHTALCRAFMETGLFHSGYLKRLLDILYASMDTEPRDANDFSQVANALVDVYATAQHFAVKHLFCTSCLTDDDWTLRWQQIFTHADPQHRLMLANAMKIAAIDAGETAPVFDSAMDNIAKDVLKGAPALTPDCIGRLGL